MLAQLGTPMYMGLIAFIAFVVGFLALNAVRDRREPFSEWDIPMTVADHVNSPRRLARVPKYPLVTDHDYYYERFGG
jgi:hypothetical protein